MHEINKELCFAIKSENLRAVQDSLDKGAQLYAGIDFRKEFMPWSWLYKCNSIPILSHILNRKECNVDYPIPELEGQTILFGAIMSCNMEKIKVLVSKGADINARDNFDDTPLSFALSLEDDECMDLIPLLLDLGADVSVGNNPLKVIKESFKEKFCEHLVEFLDRVKMEKTLKDLKLALSRVQSLVQNEKIPKKLTQELEDLEVMFSFEESVQDDVDAEVQQLLKSWGETVSQNAPIKVKEEDPIKEKEKEEEAPIKVKEEEIPVKEEEAPVNVKEEEVPVKVKEEAPIKVKEEEIPVKVEEVPTKIEIQNKSPEVWSQKEENPQLSKTEKELSERLREDASRFLKEQAPGAEKGESSLHISKGEVDVFKVLSDSIQNRSGNDFFSKKFSPFAGVSPDSRQMIEDDRNSFILRRNILDLTEDDQIEDDRNFHPFGVGALNQTEESHILKRTSEERFLSDHMQKRTSPPFQQRDLVNFCPQRFEKDDFIHVEPRPENK